MATRTVGIVGLGLFGRRVALTLTDLGTDVVAVDRDATLVDQLKNRVMHAVCLDVTDEAALRESGLLACDLIVVAIGEDMGSSILITAQLRKHGVQHVIGRSHSELHAQVLHTVGAERTLDPEEEMGMRLAQEIFAPDVFARIRLSTGQDVIEVRAHQSFVGRTVADLNFRQKYRLNIIAIKRLRTGRNPSDASPEAWEVVKLPAPTDVLHEEDKLVLIGDTEMVQTFLEL